MGPNGERKGRKGSWSYTHHQAKSENCSRQTQKQTLRVLKIDPGSTPNTSSEKASSSIVAVDSVIDEDPVDPYVVFVLAVISRF